MPTISMFYGIKIMMFFDEHNPPHFHAVYNEFKVAIRIMDLAIINGSIPPKALGLVMEWAANHQEELLENWQRAIDGTILLKINPL